jgi:hypothetical protein
VLFGNAVETGVVIMVYLENAFRERFGLRLLEDDDDSVPHEKPTITRE